MATADRFERVLENLYKAALGDVQWTSAAVLINDWIQTTSHSVSYAEAGGGGRPTIHLSRYFLGTQCRQDLIDRYFRDYYWRDEAVPRVQGLRDGEIIYKADLYSDREKEMSAAYNEFLCVNKLQSGLIMGLHSRSGCAIVFSVGNSTERRGWGHDQIRAINRLAPHLRRFVRVRRTMADAEALGSSFAELLENRRLGIIQLDRRRRILEANDRARDILLKRDGLCDKGGVLAAGHRGENAELQRLLAEAVPSYGAQGAGGSMKITRRKTPAPLVLEVHPVREMGTGLVALQVRALVLVVDPAARPRLDPDLAARLLGLSPAESRVTAARAAGQTVPDIAAALGCTQNTVKTHLKRVHRKLGIRTHAELVRSLQALESLGEPFE